MFPVEIRFEAVADGFMQEDAGPTGAEDDSHLSGRRFNGAELHNSLASGFGGEVLGSLFVEEEF